MVDSKVAEGFVELTLDTGTLTRGLSRAQKSVTRSLKSIQGSADRTGKALSLALTAPLLAAGIAAGKTAATFETNMAKIVGLVGLSAEAVDGLGKSVLELAPEVGKGPIELSEALFTITSAGARGQEALDLLTASAKAATAGLGLTEDVAKTTASAMQAFSKDNLTAAQTIAILVNIVRKGNVEGRDLASSFSRVTATAASLGLSLQETGAAMATITLTASDAAIASTQLDALFRGLGRSTPVFDKALKKLGLSFEGVQAQLQQEGLLATLRTLQTEAERTGTRLNELFVDSSAAAGAMAILNINAEIVDDIFKALADTTENDLDKAFRAITDTGAFKFTQALVSIQTASTQLGQVILPILAPIITKIAAAVVTAGNAFAELAPEMQETILNGLALAAALGPALIIISLMAGGAASLVTGLGFLARGLFAVAKGALTAVVVLGGLITLPVIIGAAIASTLAAIFLFKDAIADSFSEIGIIISGEFELAFAKTIRFIDNFTTEAAKKFDTLTTDIAEAILGLPGKIDEGLDAVALILFELPGKVVDGFDTLTTDIAEAILGGAEGVAEGIVKGAESVVDGFDTATTDIAEGIVKGFEAVTTVATDKQIKELEEKVAAATDGSSKKVAEAFSRDFEAILAGAGVASDKIKEIFSGLLDDIPGFDALANKFPELAGKLKDAIAELNESISSKFDETLKKLTGGIDNLESKTKDTASSIKDVFTDVSSSISSNITNVITGATSALDALRNVANQIIGSIISSIIGSPDGGGFLGDLFSSAKGNVFSGGSPVPFANGGIISGRTTFPMGNGGTGLAGEAGNEAIFPLSRVAGGKLGISAEGVSNDNVVINQINNFTPDVRATVREEIANAASLLINASKQATIAALSGRRT